MKFWRTPEPQPQPPAAPPSTDALEMLVHGLFDYAGMFPPASLELDAAMWESARSLRLTRPHIVGADLVVSLDDLSRIDEERLQLAGFGDTEAKLAVVAVDSGDLDEAVIEVSEKAAAMAGVMRIVSLEVHGTTFDSPSLRTAAKVLGRTQLYLEPRMPDSAWARNAPGVIRLLRNLDGNYATIGLKVRGSGANAIRPATLAWLIPQALTLGVPLKATAGLHHPIVEEAMGNAIGFVGLAAAIRLRQCLGEAFTLDNIQQCVTETQAEAFSFDGELSWRGHAVTLEALQDAMRKQPFAIGSCSLREPDQDMLRLFGPPTPQGAPSPAEAAPLTA